MPVYFLSQDVDDDQYKKVVEKIKVIGEAELISTNRFTLINEIGQNPLYTRDLKQNANHGETLTDVYKPGDPFDAYIMSSSDYNASIKDLNVKIGQFDNQKTEVDI